MNEMVTQTASVNPEAVQPEGETIQTSAEIGQEAIEQEAARKSAPLNRERSSLKSIAIATPVV